MVRKKGRKIKVMWGSSIFWQGWNNKCLVDCMKIWEFQCITSGIVSPLSSNKRRLKKKEERSPQTDACDIFLCILHKQSKGRRGVYFGLWSAHGTFLKYMWYILLRGRLVENFFYVCGNFLFKFHHFKEVHFGSRECRRKNNALSKLLEFSRRLHQLLYTPKTLGEIPIISPSGCSDQERAFLFCVTETRWEQ